MRETHIELVADFDNRGEPVFERVAAEEMPGGRFQLLASPGVAPGFAKGDIIERAEDERLGFRCIRRSGLICVQLFFTRYTDRERREVEELVSSRHGVLDGGLDGKSGRLLIFNFPIHVGFETIEATMNEISKRFEVDQWLYGNVYDTADGKTPLNWWLAEQDD